MNNQKQSLIQIGALALLSSIANAAIAENGLWTGHDYYDKTNKIGVKNGVPYSNDADVKRRLTSPLTVDGSVKLDYKTKENVKTVMKFMDSEKWDTAFPLANDIYTYDNFLMAVAKFPSFCNETNLSGWTVEKTCKRELAGMFAHWVQETGAGDDNEGEYWTQALHHVQEWRCV